MYYMLYWDTVKKVIVSIECILNMIFHLFKKKGGIFCILDGVITQKVIKNDDYISHLGPLFNLVENKKCFKNIPTVQFDIFIFVV